MDCPVCQKKMNVHRKDTSVSKTQGTRYDRTIYTCNVDGVWVTVEIPRPAITEQEVPYELPIQS